MIKKFKNGNIRIKSFYFGNDINTELYKDNIDSFYNNEITQNDLYLQQINGYSYFVDFNTQRVYNHALNDYENLLVQLDDYLKKNKYLNLYSFSKKECKSLLEDLENGY